MHKSNQLAVGIWHAANVNRKSDIYLAGTCVTYVTQRVPTAYTHGICTTGVGRIGSTWVGLKIRGFEQDIVTASPSFDMEGFVPQSREALTVMSCDGRGEVCFCNTQGAGGHGKQFVKKDDVD
jgi:hypothetical protein